MLTIDIGDWICNLQSVLSESDHATIVRCVNRYTSKSAIAKIFPRHSHPTTAINEIYILKHLPSHPLLLTRYDFLEDTNNRYIIMEEATEGDLLSHLNKHLTHLPETEVFFFFSQIVDGVDFLHQQHISHHDLKLENILLAEGKKVKIIDFEFGRHLINDPNTTSKSGTLQYVAPEVLSENIHNGYQSDLWSLGVILYILACHTFPFPDDDDADVILKIKKGAFSCPSYLSDDLLTLIIGLMTPDPNKRYTIEMIRNSMWYQYHSMGRVKKFGYSLIRKVKTWFY